MVLFIFVAMPDEVWFFISKLIKKIYIIYYKYIHNIIFILLSYVNHNPIIKCKELSIDRVRLIIINKQNICYHSNNYNKGINEGNHYILQLYW